jgi:hypothetical protein
MESALSYICVAPTTLIRAATVAVHYIAAKVEFMADDEFSLLYTVTDGGVRRVFLADESLDSAVSALCQRRNWRALKPRHHPGAGHDDSQHRHSRHSAQDARYGLGRVGVAPFSRI